MGVYTLWDILSPNFFGAQWYLEWVIIVAAVVSNVAILRRSMGQRPLRAFASVALTSLLMTFTLPLFFR